MYRTPLIHTLGRLAAAIGILAALLLLLGGSRAAAAEERTAPYLTAAFANGPGAITLAWFHQGQGVYGFAIQLQEGEQWLDATQLDHTFVQHTLANLEPETWYTLRVCAVYGPAGDADRECSQPEVRVRTQAPEQTPSGGVNASMVPPSDIQLSAGADFVRVGWGQTGPYDRILVRLTDMFGNVDQRDVGNHPNGYLEFEGMLPGTEYHVILKGGNTGGPYGPWSADASIRTDLVKNGRSSFESVNVPGHFIRHRNSLGDLTPLSSDLDRADAAFIMRSGLSGVPGSVSFESVNFPGRYLRHQNYRLILSPAEATELFRQDASFSPRRPLSGTPGAVSFESVNLPGHFIRHQNFELWLANKDAGNTALFPGDVSFWQR